MTLHRLVAITDSVAPFDKFASATATVAVKGSVTAINVTAPGAGYLTPGLKKFVDTLPGLTAGSCEQPRQLHPDRGPRHDHLSRLRLLRDRPRAVPPSVLLEPATDVDAWLRAALDERRSRSNPSSPRAADQRQPRPGHRRRTADRRRSASASTTRTTSDRPSLRPRIGPSASRSATCCRPAPPAICSCPSTPR